MTRSRRPPSAAHSKHPARGTASKQPPRRRQTIDVDVSWLEEVPEVPPRKSAKPSLEPKRSLKPSPKPSLKPSLKPSRRPAPKKTIEVELDWLEPASIHPPHHVTKRRALSPPLPREEPKSIAPDKPRRKYPPPLPREEPPGKPRRR